MTGLILARGGSKGVPKKNIKLLNGKPLISYIIEEAKISEYLTDIYVSTDDSEIKRVAKNFGAKVIDRPSVLALDDSKSIHAVQHFLNQVDTKYVVLLNACAPLTSVEDIDGACELALETGCDSVVSLVEDFSCHPSKVCELEGNVVKPLGQFVTGERQGFNKVYKRNAAIYLAKKEVIFSGTFFGKDTRGFVMPRERSFDLNTVYDFNLLEIMLKYMQ